MVAGSYSGKGVTGLLSIFTPPSLEKESYRVTSLNYSTSGPEVPVSDTGGLWLQVATVARV